MANVFETIVNFFKEDDWQVSQVEGETVLEMGFTGDNGNWMCYAHAQEDEDVAQCIFYSICPIKVMESKRGMVAEFLTRANYDLAIGNFELDFADGEIRYKTSIDVKNASLNAKLCQNLVYTNVMMMDKYLPGIMAVVYGDLLPTNAISALENSRESHLAEN